jgi:cell division protein FtsI/penicillin-binding protein 2
MKVLTGLDAVSSGVNVESMFPYRCTGDLLIDGRHFGDWIPQGHGQLADFDEALAESCNVVFADIGIRLGVERLRTFMKSAGFDGQTDLGLFKVPLGRTVGEIFNKFETAFYAIGLEHETTNTLHLAMIASAIANRGVLTQPRLVRARRSILGEEVGLPAKQPSTRVASRQAADRIVKAMVAVVTLPQGTGRRAPVDGITLALKTGTAGRRDEGYHAVIIAFAPVEQPRIAFALIAEDAGPAEYAGAKIAHDFLQGVQDRLR